MAEELWPGMSRLEVAKLWVMRHLAAVIDHSKTHVADVIAIRTAATSIQTGLDVEHVTELGELRGGRMTAPTADLLRSIHQLEVSSVTDEGDLLVGMAVGESALAGAKTLKFERHMYLLTDACSPLTIDQMVVDSVMAGLSDMNCRLHVIGLGFEGEEEEEEKSEGQEGSEAQGSEMEEESDDGDGDSENAIRYTIRSQIEKALRQLSSLRSGTVEVIRSRQDLERLDPVLRKTAVKSSVTLCLAPGLEVAAKSMLVAQKRSDPTLKQKVVLMDDNEDRPMVDDDGAEEVGEFRRHTEFLDEQNVVDAETSRVKAIPYGNDLLPMTLIDFEGLKESFPDNGPPPRMDIIGYTQRSKFPPTYLRGPPYIIAGSECSRACTLIANLSQTLTKQKKVAICTFSKTAAGRAILGVLIPHEEEDCKGARLLFLQLPFASEVKTLESSPLPELVESLEKSSVDQARACDDLIDAFQLDDDTGKPGTVPSPLLRSWRHTVVARVVDSEADLVHARSHSDPMAIDRVRLEQGRSALNAFYIHFPLSKSKAKEQEEMKSKLKGKGKRTLSYKDFL